MEPRQPGTALDESAPDGCFSLKSIVGLALTGAFAAAVLSVVVGIVLNNDYRANQVGPDDMDGFAYLGFGFSGGFLCAFACPIGAALGASIGSSLGHKKVGTALGAAACIALAVAVPWAFT